MNRQFKTLTLLVAGLLLAGALAACGDYTATPVPTIGAITTVSPTVNAVIPSTSDATLAGSTGSDTIVIYSSLPLTGSSQAEAEALNDAMKMALEDFTGGTGKVGNYTINFIPLDDATAAKGQWDAAQETANANQAVANPNAMVYLATFNSGAAQISIPVLNKAGMAMVSPANTYPGLTHVVDGSTLIGDPDNYYKANPLLRNYFRVVTSDDGEGYAAAAFMASLKVKKVFVIDDSVYSGQELAHIFANTCQDYGLDCSQGVSITGREADYKYLANVIKAKGFDAIFFGGSPQQHAGKLISDLRASGITVPFLSGDNIHDKVFITDARTAAEGAYTLVQGLDETKLPQKGQDFLKRYRARFGQVGTYTIYAYEAMSVTLAAINRVGVKDRARIVQALAATRDFEGALGKWSFDKNGDTTLTDYSVYQVKEGNWSFVTLTRPK